MNPRLLQWLVCPSCRASLRLQGGAAPAEILEDELVCERGHRFPVTRGVPRFVHPAQLPRTAQRSRAAFGYEWSAFADYDVKNFHALVMPEPPQFFAGKLGLDVGCGAGRHLLAAAQAGADMIGVDQSEAVDVAQSKIASLPRAHVMQADLQSLPLRHHTVDFLYSWGVLHHLAQPEAAFQSLLPYLKPGGLIIVGLYHASLRKRLLEWPRAVTTRLPLPLVHGIATCCAVVDYVGGILPYRLAARVVGPRLAQLAPAHLREYAKYPFRVSEADWFDRLAAPITHWYTREEVARWFERAQLQEARVEPIGDFWWRGQGRLPC